MGEKTFAADKFYTKAGMLDITSREPLTVAFLGGSLTEGHVDYEGTSLGDDRLKWANVMIKFLSGLFPHRPLKAVNSGLGGTGTEYGAARFYRDILRHDPDLIFIEFSCNDTLHQPSDRSEKGRTERQIYLEGIIRQCMKREKVPVIIYMHVPLPYEDDALDRYLTGCEYKQQILDYYGIGTVDAMADFRRQFEVEVAENDALTLHDCFDRYYKRNPNTPYVSYDVHPNGEGYLLFAKSLINAIVHEPEKYFRRFEMKHTPYRADFSDKIEAKYTYISASDERIKYVGDWEIYTKDNKFVTDDPDTLIREDKFIAPHQFPDGIGQVLMPKGAEFSFVTSADEILMPHVSARAGLEATVYVNGVALGKTGCRSIYHGMNFLGPRIALPKGEKTVKFVIDDADDKSRVFRFGYIIEVFFG